MRFSSMQNIDYQILRCAKDLWEFTEGSVVRNIYSGKTYVITRHYKNGMCNLYQPNLCMNENWNAYNNRQFISSDISLPILCLIGN